MNENAAMKEAPAKKSRLKLYITLGIIAVLVVLVAPMTYSKAVNEVYNPFKIANMESDRLWAEVANQYQRRSDLIPNLVAVVSQAAGHENQTLKEVTEARARANSIQLTPEALKDPAAMAQFQRVQGDLTNALSKLMMLTENYPQLKVNENFLNLQSQVEGTENRITVARNRYINSVPKVNVIITTWPNNLFAKFLGLAERPQFHTDSEQAMHAPVIPTYQRKD